MKVILEMPESVADVLAITAIKGCGFQTKVSIMSVDLHKGDHIVFDDNSNMTNQFFEREVYT